MSVGDALRRLAQGQSTPALLHTCRLEAFGTSFQGEEAVLQALRQQGDDLAKADVLVGARHAVLLGEGVALIADLFDGRIGRLWRIGPAIATPAETGIAVAFDPDLTQARGGLFMRAEDHPELPPDALPQVQASAETLIARESRALRTRLFLIRAFAADGQTVALFARYRLQPGEALGFSYVAARCSTEPCLFEDEGEPSRTWRASFL